MGSYEKKGNVSIRSNEYLVCLLAAIDVLGGGLFYFNCQRLHSAPILPETTYLNLCCLVFLGEEWMSG